MDEIQAAILDVKLKYLDADINKRREVARCYYERIDNPLVELPEQLPDENNVYHLFPIIVKQSTLSFREGMTISEMRNLLHDYLERHGIGTVIHYPIAPHKQECYAKEAWNVPQLSLPITEMLADSELSLPISPCMTQEQVKYVVDVINEWQG